MIVYYIVLHSFLRILQTITYQMHYHWHCFIFLKKKAVKINTKYITTYNELNQRVTRPPHWTLNWHKLKLSRTKNTFKLTVIKSIYTMSKQVSQEARTKTTEKTSFIPKSCLVFVHSRTILVIPSQFILVLLYFDIKIKDNHFFWCSSEKQNKKAYELESKNCNQQNVIKNLTIHFSLSFRWREIKKHHVMKK